MKDIVTGVVLVVSIVGLLVALFVVGRPIVNEFFDSLKEKEEM